MKYLYVANWKMNLSFNESIDFCTKNQEVLQELTSKQAEVVLCPSYIAVAPIVELLKKSTLKIGAQNCSEHISGSFTGEVSAQSLAQAGATYCIVGHTEQRLYHAETTNGVINKMNLLYQHNIMPIICIGETKEDFLEQKTIDALTGQLELILKTAAQQKYAHIIIAYEPFWVIGTGIIPENKYLKEIFAWLDKYVNSYLPHCTKQLLYGGNVTEKNILPLKKIPNINGFLIGRASTDFEQFSAILKS